MRDDFSSLLPPPDMVERFPPEQRALFDYIRTRVTDDLLEVVAKCDYGNSVDLHMAELKRLRNGIEVEQPLKWQPSEVLELFRWSTSDDDIKDRQRFHLTRAFCAGALLVTHDEYDNRSSFNNDSLASLTESCLFLGPEYLESLGKYLTWSLTTMSPWEDEFLFHAFALLVVAAHLGASTPTLEDWLVRANREILPWHSSRSYDDAKAFLDLKYLTISADRWRSLARLTQERLQPAGELSHLLEQIAREKNAAKKLEDLKDWAQVARVAGHFLWKALKNKVRRP